jgi:hypothetical protein
MAPPRTVEMHGTAWTLSRTAKGRDIWTGTVKGRAYRLVDGREWLVYVDNETEPVGAACHASDGARVAWYHANKR